jgi:hypothetical protein
VCVCFRLHTTLRCISAINRVVGRIEQTCEHARALAVSSSFDVPFYLHLGAKAQNNSLGQFLKTQATTFLKSVQHRLDGVDPAPYLDTVVSLEV